GKLFSIWKRMKEREERTFWLTIISQGNSSFLSKGKFVKISISGNEIENLPLYSEVRKSYFCSKGKITVIVKKGKVWVEESSCKNKICVKTSPVSYAGERIICAPNRFLLEIKGNSGVDTSIG
ncbi:NusG domain II-containing protein, partial [Candidatus Aminicenantes bacterium AC-335-A11]|nr:NusG domain II-containing protein [Candidatus Aminicenantes bacterium AC-335-A11]